MKKIVILLLTISSAIYAGNYYFMVQTPEEVNIYANIFNAIAEIFGSENYLHLLRLVFLFGGFMVFVKGVISSFEGKTNVTGEYLKYSLIVVALLSIIFSQTGTIIVKSKSLPTYCSPGSSSTAGVAVGNIPEVIAYAYSFFNRIGVNMTKMTETAFTPPTTNYGNYSLGQNAGYMGALKSTMKVLGADTSIMLSKSAPGEKPVNLPLISKTIFAQCILIPFSARGASGLAQITKLKSSSDIFGYLNNLYSKNPDIGGTKARDFEAKMGGDIWKCGKLWDYAKPSFQKYKQMAACSYNTNAAAISIITGIKTPSKSDFQNTILQSALISGLQNAKTSLGTGISGINYAIGRSKAEFVQTELAKGAYTAKMLPLLQTTLRAVLYAMFPFTFVIILFPGGLKVLTEYMKAILWIELWTPMAAILNMFMIQYAESRMSGEYAKSGLTVVNAINYLGSGATIAGVAGYLYASVPALTWLFLSGSEVMLSNFGSNMASFMTKNIRTQTFLKDTTEISKRNEVRVKTGKDISIAEIQHFEAVKNGTVSGAVLGTDMNIGVKDLADTESFNEASNVANFTSLRQGTGLTNPEKLANENASARNMNAISQMNANSVNGITGKNGYFTQKGQRLLNQNTKKRIGEQKATLAVNRSVASYENQSMNLEAKEMTSAKTFQIWREMNHSTNKEAAIAAANVEGTNEATQMAVDKYKEIGLNTWNNEKNINPLAKNIAGSDVRNIETGIAENKALNNLGLTPPDVGQMKAGQTAKTYQNLERQMKEYGKKSGFGQSWNKKSLAQKLEYYGKHDAITVDYTGSAFGQRISERATTAVTPNGEDVTHTNVDVNGTYSTSFNNLADFGVDTLIARNLIINGLEDLELAGKTIQGFNKMRKKLKDKDHDKEHDKDHDKDYDKEHDKDYGKGKKDKIEKKEHVEDKTGNMTEKQIEYAEYEAEKAEEAALKKAKKTAKKIDLLDTDTDTNLIAQTTLKTAEEDLIVDIEHGGIPKNPIKLLVLAAGMALGPAAKTSGAADMGNQIFQGIGTGLNVGLKSIYRLSVALPLAINGNFSLAEQQLIDIKNYVIKGSSSIDQNIINIAHDFLHKDLSPFTFIKAESKVFYNYGVMIGHYSSVAANYISIKKNRDYIKKEAITFGKDVYNYYSKNTFSQMKKDAVKELGALAHYALE